jgi:hypothetical protein
MRRRLWREMALARSGSSILPLFGAAIARLRARRPAWRHWSSDCWRCRWGRSGRILNMAVRLLIVPAVLFDGARAGLLFARWTSQIHKEGAPPVGEVCAPWRGMQLIRTATLVVAFALTQSLGRGALPRD